MKKILLASSIVIALFSACKPEPLIDVSYQKALMDKHWILKDIQINPDVNTATNTWYSTFGSALPCLKDNKWYFTSTSGLLIDEGFTKCTTSDPQQTTLFYSIPNDNYMKIFTNKANIDGSIVLKGAFKMIDINTFSIDERTPDPFDATIIKSTIYTYEKSQD